MRNWPLKLYVYAQMLKDERGQDLIEYALVAALIAFAAVGSMGTLASKINNAFLTIGSSLDNAMTNVS